MLLGVLASSLSLIFDPASVAASTPGPLPIVGGTDALQCEWPSTVALNSGTTTYCSGTLIHPSVVITAAHCLHPANGWGNPTTIVFGEQGAAPELAVGITGCELHPEYVHEARLHSPADAHDLAYCTLAQPVTTIAPTPVIMGCEVDQLVPGAEVDIVGFGANSIEPAGGGFEVNGVGVKRHIAQTLEQVDALDQLFLVGAGGSACSGDSGGSAFLQLDDGSWRTLATTARIHPDAPRDPPYCTYGVIYTGVWNEMDWFEAQTGFDLTPCHDPDGTWNPGADCTGFPLEPQAAATWADGCAAQSLSGAGQTCAPDMGSTGGGSSSGGDSDETGADSTGEDTGSPPGSTGGLGSSGGLGSGDSTSAAPATDTGLPGGTADGSSTGAAGQDDEGGGCGCRSDAGRGHAGFGLLLIPWLWVRRRRASA
ncbi:MAG: trypsin-like serine protease [Deltaproteobacteria bacterium]|nr:trypsin-like serine protease [Deltaproteobacteria bacterium]